MANQKSTEKILNGNNEFKWDTNANAWVPTSRTLKIAGVVSDVYSQEFQNLSFPLEIVDEDGVEPTGKDVIKIPFSVIDRYYNENVNKNIQKDDSEFTISDVKQYVTTGTLAKPTAAKPYETSFDISEVKARGAVEVAAEDGTEVFRFNLPSPESPSGELVAQNAVLLPDPATNKYYVDTLDNAIEMHVDRATSTNSVAELKKKLWESGYIDNASYLKSIQGSLANLPDTALRMGLATSLSEMSIYNKGRIDSGKRDIMTLDSHLDDVYSAKFLTGETYTDVPTRGSLDTLLENAYTQRLGRKPTQSEFDAFEQVVQQEILSRPSQTYQVKTPSGFSAPITYEGFDLTDMSQLAEELANKSPGRSSYYGASTFARGLMDAIKGEFGSGTESLEELLR